MIIGKMNNKKSQASMLDLLISSSIIGIVLIIVIAVVALLNIIRSPDFDEYMVYNNFKQQLTTKPIFNSNRIDFLDGSFLNLTRFQNFGDIALHNMTIFRSYFFNLTNNLNLYDPCIFILNSTNEFVHTPDGRFAFGNVSTTKIYSSAPLVECQTLISSGMGPCHYYESNVLITKPVFINGTYATVNYVFCRV